VVLGGDDRNCKAPIDMDLMQLADAKPDRTGIIVTALALECDFFKKAWIPDLTAENENVEPEVGST